MFSDKLLEASATMSKNSATTKPIRVAVLGNPNTGKSTLFNALTGIRQQTGNYPGVTVAKHTGRMSFEDQEFELIDLPGTYSLAPRSPDEVVTVNVLLGTPPADSPPDLILCVVDAANLPRNLFLVSQILDLHQPTVVALNMTDVALRKGLEIDLLQLEKLLGVPVVGIQAKRRTGFLELKQAMQKAIGHSPAIVHDPFTAELRERISRLEAAIPDNDSPKRFAVTRMLFDTDGSMTGPFEARYGESLVAAVRGQQTELAASGESLAEMESHARYQWIKCHLDSFSKQGEPQPGGAVSDRLDHVLTHPLWGLLTALIVLLLLFRAVFWAAEPASTMIDWFNGTASGWVSQFLAPGALHSLITDGLINGVGSVLVFLPQILLLFFILAVLEDSGYLARAAFLMDKFLSRIGLSGITLFPLLSSFACAIPGIMATRVIKDPRERLITILIAPLMSCSARLPVYVLLIAAFVPQETYLGGLLGLQAMTMFAMYLIGVVVAIGVAWVLKKTILKTGTSSFVMELPSYKLPSLRNITQRMWEGGWSFVRDAGTLIVAVTVLVWAAGYFPRGDQTEFEKLSNDKSEVVAQIEALGDEPSDLELQPLEEELEGLQNQLGRLQAAQLRRSFLGRVGRWIEPVVIPLGWDWRIGSAAIASFPAREVVVSTMGVIFGLGDDVNEETPSLRQTLKNATWENSDRKLFTLPVALSLMVFFALCAQCVSTLAVMKRETNSWRWPIFTFVYMTTLAYVAAWLTYQLGSWLGGT